MSRRNARNSRRSSVGRMTPAQAMSSLINMSLETWTFDRYNVDGVSGKLGSLIGWKDATHLLAQATSANQVAVPATHSDFAGRACGTFSGAEYYVSNKAASARNNAHNGTGEEWVLVFTPTTIGADHRPLATRTTGVTIGTTMALASGVPTMFVSNGAAIFMNFGGGGALSANVPIYMSISYVEGRSPDEAVIFRKGTQVAQATNATAPTASDAAFALSLGATAAGGQGLVGRIAAAMLFQPLNANTRALMQTWIRIAFGLAP
jgi:hypothetical protein